MVEGFAHSNTQHDQYSAGRNFTWKISREFVTLIIEIKQYTYEEADYLL